LANGCLPKGNFGRRNEETAISDHAQVRTPVPPGLSLFEPTAHELLPGILFVGRLVGEKTGYGDYF